MAPNNSRSDFSREFPKIADMLACSRCGANLHLEQDKLRCAACGAEYPIVDGIPILTPQQP